MAILEQTEIVAENINIFYSFKDLLYKIRTIDKKDIISIRGLVTDFVFMVTKVSHKRKKNGAKLNLKFLYFIEYPLKSQHDIEAIVINDYQVGYFDNDLILGINEPKISKRQIIFALKTKERSQL